MTKHILLSTEDPGVGGVAQYNNSLLSGLARLGYQVTSLQPQLFDDSLISHQKQLDIQYLWRNEDTLQNLPQILTQPGNKPELLICSNSNPFSNLAIKQIAIRLGIPYIVVEHLVEPHLAEQFGAYLDELLYQYKKANSVIAVSYDNLKLLHEKFKLPKDKGQVIYNGRPSEYFSPNNLSLRENLRQVFSIPSEAIVCFTAARIETRKGYQYQLEAIKQLMYSPVWSNLYFVWAGAGIFEPQLEKELQQAVDKLGISDKIIFLGQRSDISDWLNVADIFVFPSMLEGMPLCVIEAMAKGLPVIASNVSGIPEELGETGKLLTDPKIDPQATVRELVAAIQELVINPDLRLSIGQGCKQRAEAIFREERMIQETVKVIEKALLPVGDYVSPGFEIIRPDQSFPNMIMGDTKTSGWSFLRRDIAHNWYVDRRQPGIGFLNRDEAHIIYNTALKFKGKKSLEIGCWLGWSACHLALAGVELDVVDPLLAKPEIYESVSNSLKSAGVLNSVNLVAGYSPQKVEELADRLKRKWSLIFIDGNHDASAPLNDAIICEQFAEADALILFHDLNSPDVAQGLDYLKHKGWNTMVYQTMQIMGVAWRGNIEPVQHQPDPKIYWHLPKHLQHYSVSGVSANEVISFQQVEEMMQQAIALLQNGKSVEAMRTAEKAASQGIYVPNMHLIRSICLCNVGRNEEGFQAVKEELALNAANQQAQHHYKALASVLSKPVTTKIPNHERPWRTTLPRETMLSIQHASHNYSYRGVPMIKNPFDFALYPLLLWTLKPRTIIEIGSKDGGSALWFGDMLNNFGIDGHIYSIDIVKVTSVEHPRVTYMEGNGRALHEILTPDFLNSLPRPLLVIEDADHTYDTSHHVLEFFHPYIKQGEYIVIEDGIISDLIQDSECNSGPHRALKEFLETYPNQYEIDGDFCDFFAYNLTWCTNGFLKKRANITTKNKNFPICAKFYSTIIVDGVFFQLYQTGIARVWQSLLEEWTKNSFAKHIIVLDRAGTAPKIPGIRYRSVQAYNYNNTDADREMLQQVCDEEGADLFISTYYTTPITTPSVLMIHDMIPEIFGWNLENSMWREKHYGIRHATGYLAVSENTAKDLVAYFPDIHLDSVIIAKNGVNHQIFIPVSQEKVKQFRNKYGVPKPYFLLVGAGAGYKNSILFFQSFSQLAVSYGFDIVCTGSGGLLTPEFRTYTSGIVIHMLQLSDEELATAYSGAVALVYPSKYEGFGMPIIEAMACGCPVITCPNASLPEVAGEAAIYIKDDDVQGLADALCEVQKPSVRQSLIAAGLEQAKKFSWSKMANIVSSALIDATLLPLNLKEINLIIFPDWSQPEESLCLELERVIKAIATYLDSQPITLLIDTSNIATEDAELLLSGITMNLLMQEDLDVTENLEISLVGNLADIQWDALLSRIHARIVLEHENQNALIQAKSQNLTSYEIDEFSKAQAEQFFFT
ncbi:CmcI family methyltransferase [Fischerella sp. PCC 9605]|uniref:CmcI family methyltransferase n=1 Tax=Fischerella sp. PCC 9605 TaxID=1173024 RepID=UPI0004ACF2DC|nr:CmcI family methyltransferase [Fischerella sp. PCC 9605]